MGEFSKALALEDTVEHRGKTYRLSGLTFEVIGQFESFLRRRAWQNMLDYKAWMPAAEYAEQCASLRRDIDAGLYDFLSETSVKAQGTLAGLRKLVFFRLHANHPEATEAEVQDLIEAKLEEVKRTLEEMDSDPNPSAPTAAADSTSSQSVPALSGSPGT